MIFLSVRAQTIHVLYNVYIGLPDWDYGTDCWINQSGLPDGLDRVGLTGVACWIIFCQAGLDYVGWV